MTRIVDTKYVRCSEYLRVGRFRDASSLDNRYYATSFGNQDPRSFHQMRISCSL